MVTLHLPDDLLLNVLVLLPFESLCRLCLVCKAWFNLINSSMFFQIRNQLCEEVLVSLYDWPREPVRPTLFRHLGASLSGEQRCQFHFSKFCNQNRKTIAVNSNTDSKNILAVGNSLVLVTTEKDKGFLVIDPMAGKYVRLPLGTIGFKVESYGIMFSHYTYGYKVVHLFLESNGSISCELLRLSTRSWRSVDGPSHGLFSSSQVLQKPVSVLGGLYWLPDKYTSTYLVCMKFDEECFVMKSLPARSTLNDRLLDMAGNLCFVTRTKLQEIQLWILKNGQLEEEWTLKYSIKMSCDTRGLLPICVSSKNERIVFETGATANSHGKQKIQVSNFEGVMTEMVGAKLQQERHAKYFPYFLPMNALPCL